MRLIPQTLIPRFLRPSVPPQAEALFASAMAAARRPAFYTDLGFADDMDGRTEALMLHLALLYRRLRGIEPHGLALWRDTLDHAMAEIERAMRDVGVGDVTVPKKMRRVAEAFYGRAGAYDAALDAGDRGALRDALIRNVYAGAAPGAAAQHTGEGAGEGAGEGTGEGAGEGVAEGLARAVEVIAADLDAQADADLMAGQVRFPGPMERLAPGGPGAGDGVTPAKASS